jgi:hypothetical protein
LPGQLEVGGLGKRLEAGELDGVEAHGGQAKGEAAMIAGGWRRGLLGGDADGRQRWNYECNRRLELVLEAVVAIDFG